MPREFSRVQRVGEQIQRVLAQLIQQEIDDPRLGMVTVSHVVVSRDLAHAKVYVTVLGEPAAVETSLAILNKAAGFLRHALGREVQMRVIPQLRFVYDESLARAASVSALIDQAVAADRHEGAAGEKEAEEGEKS